MAELHGRVYRVQNRARLIAVALVLWCAPLNWGVASRALAQPAENATSALTLPDLHSAAEALGSESREAREAAIQTLGSMPSSALPAIAQRVREMRRQRVPTEDGYEALNRFRRQLGSRRADDMIDIAPGIRGELNERRGRVTRRMAERLLVLRSLEAIGDLESQRMMLDIFALDPQTWRWESRRIAHRMRERLLPGMILAKGYEGRSMKDWGRARMRALGRATPAFAVQELDETILANVITAYGEIREMDAMEVIISFVGHQSSAVRSAARAAMERYGRNAIWRFREAMRNQLGTEANRSWGWRRTARALYDGLDQRRLAPLLGPIENAETKLQEGELLEAIALVESVLQEHADPPGAERIAEIYARAANAPETSTRDRERWLRRAVWLAPESAQSGLHQAALDRMMAEQDLAAGRIGEDAAAQLAQVEEEARVAEEAREAAESPEPERAEEENLGEGEGIGLAAIPLAVAFFGLLYWAYTERERFRSFVARWIPANDASANPPENVPEPDMEPGPEIATKSAARTQPVTATPRKPAHSAIVSAEEPTGLSALVLFGGDESRATSKREISDISEELLAASSSEDTVDEGLQDMLETEAEGQGAVPPPGEDAFAALVFGLHEPKATDTSPGTISAPL